MSLLFINKSDRGYLTLFPVKISILLFDWKYVMYVTNFKVFYMSHNNVHDTS